MNRAESAANYEFGILFPEIRRRKAAREIMRISGGAARGIPLLVPSGSLVRPATDALRQAVFSSLGAAVGGARFLDLFAGSGAYGLEAFSRGAVAGSFVENSPKALGCLRKNIGAVCKCLGRPETELAVRPGDARTVPLDGAGAPDLVFVDPPYEMIAKAALPLFARLAIALESKPDALIIFEMPGETALAPPGWTEIKRLGRGARQPTVGFFKRS
jgi:16S rRNA (guanine966-N2)-methyltransferase